MKRLSNSTIVAGLLAAVALASVAPAFATTPECGGDKEEKGGTSKPAPAPTPAPKPPA